MPVVVRGIPQAEGIGADLPSFAGKSDMPEVYSPIRRMFDPADTAAGSAAANTAAGKAADAVAVPAAAGIAAVLTKEIGQKVVEIEEPLRKALHSSHRT